MAEVPLAALEGIRAEGKDKPSRGILDRHGYARVGGDDFVETTQGAVSGDQAPFNSRALKRLSLVWNLNNQNAVEFHAPHHSEWGVSQSRWGGWIDVQYEA